MAIITRQGKGSALTHAELDNNFKELESGTVGLEQLWEVAETGVDSGSLFNDGTSNFRQPNVTYTNDTGKTIFISLLYITNGGSLTVDNEIVATSVATVSGVANSITFPIPNGSTYMVDNIGFKWLEFRSI